MRAEQHVPPSTPGLARRHGNFAAVAALAADAPMIEDMTYRRCEYTLKRARSLLDISRAAHQVLLLLLDRLTADSWREAEYVVWPSNATLAEESGDSPRAVARCLAELERAGLVARWYTPANRRMSMHGRAAGGIDLAPLASRFSEIEAAIESAELARAERRDAVFTRRKDTSWEDDKLVSQEQSPKTNTAYSVTEKSEPPARFSTNPNGINHEATNIEYHSTDTDPDCSPGGETGFSSEASLRPSSLAEPPRAALQRAWELSPKLQAVVGLVEISSGAPSEILGHIRRAVRALMPERNTVMSFDWLFEAHGWVAVDCLVAALEDPIVKIGPSNWLGGFAREEFRGRKLDFDANLRRIAALREFEEAASPKPSEPAAHAELPELIPPSDSSLRAIWDRLHTHVVARSGEATWRSWFGHAQFISIENGTLHVEVPSRFYADRFSGGGELSEVAHQFGLAVKMAIRRAVGNANEKLN